MKKKGLCLLCALVLGVLLSAAGCGSRGQTAAPGDEVGASTSSTAPSAGPTSTGVTTVVSGEDLRPAGGLAKPADLLGIADVVVLGRVREVQQPRWNSAHGLDPVKHPELDAGLNGGVPMVYTTYLLDPIKYLKGSSIYGEPVPFRAEGGIVNDQDGETRWLLDYLPDIKVGDEVLVFLKDVKRGGVYTPPAYWLEWGPEGVFVRTPEGSYDRTVRSLGPNVQQDTIDLPKLEEQAATAQ